MEINTATSNKDTRVSREQLYEEVWAEPMTTVALKYNVSSSFLARICTRLNVPRPQRGYWAMYATGKRPKKPSLPIACPGDELEWVRHGGYARVAQLPLHRRLKAVASPNVGAEGYQSSTRCSKDLRNRCPGLESLARGSSSPGNTCCQILSPRKKPSIAQSR